MKSINEVRLLGYVGKDPELKEFDKRKVAKFSLATTKHFIKDDGHLSLKSPNECEWQEVTEWHNITAWNYIADYVMKYVTKGTRLYLEGELKYTEFEKDGIKKYFTEIIAKNIICLDLKETGEKKVIEGIPF